MSDKPGATIARIWKGRTVRAKADAYESYWLSQLPPLRERALALAVFREDRGEETEFTSISYWADETSMLAFSKSDDPTAVHHLPRDKDFLIELPRSVQLVRVLAVPPTP